MGITIGAIIFWVFFILILVVLFNSVMNLFAFLCKMCYNVFWWKAKMHIDEWIKEYNKFTFVKFTLKRLAECCGVGLIEVPKEMNATDIANLDKYLYFTSPPFNTAYFLMQMGSYYAYKYGIFMIIVPEEAEQVRQIVFKHGFKRVRTHNGLCIYTKKYGEKNA